MAPQVIIAGDVWPVAVGTQTLAERLGLAERPELFLWTLDGVLAAGTARPGQTCLPFEAADLDELRLAKVNVAVTASNHVTDFGDAGLRATLGELSSRGFEHVGAGCNRQQADQNLYLDLPMGRVAILAFAETDSRVYGIPAGPNSGGIRPLLAETCLAAVADAANQADWVWVVLHWGEEFVRYPDPSQRQLAWDLVDAGASLIVASHVHVPLGYERRGDKLIAYGLGNLIFPPYRELRGFTYRWHPTARQGIVLEGQCRQSKWEWSLREIRHDGRGLPRLGQHGNCPDYARTLPTSLEEYQRQYPALRKRERLHFMWQRILFMNWQERLMRIERLFRRGSFRSATGPSIATSDAPPPDGADRDLA